jgi:hypothetical protein
MTTHEVDAFGMSLYGVVSLDIDDTEDGAPMSDRVYVAKATIHGLVGMQATPQEVADFLEYPQAFYARRLGEFSRIHESVHQFRPDEIQAMDLPKSLFAHWCPHCEAPWPDALVREEEALEHERFHVFDGQWVLVSTEKEDLDNPGHSFRCTECKEIVTVDVAGRDLEELYAEMWQREADRQARYDEMDRLMIAEKQAECDRLNRERWDREARAEMARIEAEAVAEGKRKTQEAIDLGELCPHCQSPMPNHLVAHQDAIVSWDVEENELGVWKFFPGAVTTLDDITYICGACEKVVEWNDAWDHIEAGDDIDIANMKPRSAS